MERLNQWLSLIASIGVLVGIAAVIYELQQNTSAVLGETQQGLLELIHTSDSWLQDPAFADIVYRAEELDETLEGAEARQFMEWLYGKINACELVYERYQQGILSEYYWQGWDAGCTALLDSPQGRHVWAERRTWYGEDFREYFDAYVERLR